MVDLAIAAIEVVLLPLAVNSVETSSVTVCRVDCCVPPSPPRTVFFVIERIARPLGFGGDAGVLSSAAVWVGCFIVLPLRFVLDLSYFCKTYS